MNKSSSTATTTTATATTTTTNTHSNSTSNSNNIHNGTARSSRSDKNNEPLHARYPVLSSWQFVLSNVKEPVSGVVYCTDETSQTLILIPSSSLVEAQQQSSSSLSSSSTSLATSTTTEIRILNANCIIESTKIGDPNPNDVESLSLPTTPILKKTLEDRERRAMRQAEEVFRHINEKVSVFCTQQQRQNFKRRNCSPHCSRNVPGGQSMLLA